MREIFSNSRSVLNILKLRSIPAWSKAVSTSSFNKKLPYFILSFWLILLSLSRSLLFFGQWFAQRKLDGAEDLLL